MQEEKREKINVKSRASRRVTGARSLPLPLAVAGGDKAPDAEDEEDIGGGGR